MPDLAPPRPHSNQPAVAGLLAQAEQTVRVAQALVDAGRDIELAGLDDMVGVACAQALDLPPNEGRAVHPQMAALLDACDALRHALTVPQSRQKAESCPSPLQPS